jgi:hypothetical protein
MVTRIGDYRLDQPIEEASDVIEYKPDEYSMHQAAGMERFLEDERIYNGRSVSFSGVDWSTTIATTEGRIYKIAIQHMTRDKRESASLFQRMLNQLTQEMGKPSEHRLLSRRYIWDAPEGNVLLDRLDKFGWSGVNLMLTSSSIHPQVRDIVGRQDTG